MHKTVQCTMLEHLCDEKNSISNDLTKDSLIKLAQYGVFLALVVVPVAQESRPGVRVVQLSAALVMVVIRLSSLPVAEGKEHGLNACTQQ